MLYVNELASGASLALDGDVDQRIKDAIASLLARQGANGSFGLWSAGGDDAWLDAYVTEFLTRARERKFEVPDTAFKLALDRLRNAVAAAPEPTKDGGRDLAYALYVLARNGAAPVGDLRYLADVKINDVATPIAKAQIAAALAMMGDKARAERVYARGARRHRAAAGAGTRPHRLRLGAARQRGAGDAGLGRRCATHHDRQRAWHASTQRAALSAYTSTQEQAWLVLAARALAKEVERDFADRRWRARIRACSTAACAPRISSRSHSCNTGDGTVQAVVSVSGAPLTPEPAAERGFKIERSFFTLAGEPADPSKAQQNQRFAVVSEGDRCQSAIRASDGGRLSAGRVRDRQSASGVVGRGRQADWIADGAEPANAQFRDDRFSAAFERKSGDPAVFTVAYVVRAVSPGSYVLPQAVVEDMYRPDRFGRTATGAVEITAAK